MKIYSRNNILYVRMNGTRKSTKLKDTPNNRKLLENQYKHNEFFKKFDVNTKMSKVIDLCKLALDEKMEILKPTSIKSYESVFKQWIIPYFNKKYISEIKPIDIKNWYNKFNDKSTLLTAQTILSCAIETALLSQEISSSPLAGVKLPKIKSDYEINPFTLEEMSLILSEEDHIKNLMGVAFFTGLRMGEIIALRWSDIDFNKMTINIQHTRTKGFLQEPKTKSSKAIIDLPYEALPYFQNEKLKNGLREFCFYNKKGKIYQDAGNVAYLYKRLLKRVGLGIRGIHQTRHTFASVKLMMGERLEWVSYMLRHKSPKITLDKYYKYMPRENEKRVIIELPLAQKRHSS